MHEPAVNDFQTVFPSIMMSFFKLPYEQFITRTFAGLELPVQGGFLKVRDGSNGNPLQKRCHYGISRSLTTSIRNQIGYDSNEGRPVVIWAPR